MPPPAASLACQWALRTRWLAPRGSGPLPRSSGPELTFCMFKHFFSQQPVSRSCRSACMLSLPTLPCRKPLRAKASTLPTFDKESSVGRPLHCCFSSRSCHVVGAAPSSQAPLPPSPTPACAEAKLPPSPPPLLPRPAQVVKIVPCAGNMLKVCCNLPIGYDKKGNDVPPEVCEVGAAAHFNGRAMQGRLTAVGGHFMKAVRADTFAGKHVVQSWHVCWSSGILQACVHCACC